MYILKFFLSKMRKNKLTDLVYDVLLKQCTYNIKLYLWNLYIYTKHFQFQFNELKRK